MKGLLTGNRERISAQLKTAESRRFFSPSTYGDYVVTKAALRKFARGRLLDIGCGVMPFKDIILEFAEEYDTFDREERVSGVKYIGDIQNMEMIEDGAYDSAVCLEVLEHVPDPFRAVAEISRILKKNGTLICSVPHLSRLHEEPHDYYRFTKYGIETLLTQAEFKVLDMRQRGGLFTFLGHQFSSCFVCLFWHIPVVKHVVFFLNKWFCTLPCQFLDRFILRTDVFAEGYTVVAEKVG